MIKQKTDQEWSKIRFQNSLGPQIGGIGHDVAVYMAAGLEPTKKNIDNVKKWIDTLYEIAEQKKAQLTEVKPLNIEKAVKLGDKWRKETKIGYEENTEEINKKIQSEVDEGREKQAEDKLNYQ